MEYNQQKFEQLRRQYPVFAYKSFHYAQDGRSFDMEFRFAVRDTRGEERHVFTPTLKIPARKFYKTEEIPQDLLETLVFHCGLMELVSYWKCCCPPTVKIECGHLSEPQKAWFKKLYFLGLGEFFYLNGITTSLQDFMQVECLEQPVAAPLPSAFQTSENDIIVPVGGGKDSVVSLEVLRNVPQARIRPMIVNPRGATRNCCLQAGFEDQDCIVVNRSIDPHLLELNRQGFLNGHTPFSAMLAFASLVTAALSRSRHIALSNENSAEESTVPGREINHQYSKSLEFENDFRHYVKTFINPQFDYFSFLRPLSEIGIARLFAALPRYHGVFRSCNAGSKTDSWCGKCPKCLFAFIILCPFMGMEKTSRLFGKNLFDDAQLQPCLDELAGIAPVKPFECVGTVDEVRWALLQMKPQAKGHVLLARFFAKEDLPPTDDTILNEFSPQNNLPPLFAETLRKAVENVRQNESAGHKVEIPCSEEVQRKFGPFFGKAEKIAIVGLGREGISTYKLIRKIFPEKPLLLVDFDERTKDSEIFSNDRHVDFLCGKNYLDDLAKAEPGVDLFVKTPGISFRDFPALLESPKLTSQTDLFLRAYSAQTIGITGTKGKSTTTALACHLLAPFRPCISAGNMGIPLFDILDEITPRTCLVCEFSAHQLEQARTSPHIGVLLNLYEEHLDHYRSFVHYQHAKANIAGDPAKDIVIFHDDDSLVRERIEERARAFQTKSENGNLFSYSLNHPVKKGLYATGNGIFDGETNQLVFSLEQPHPLVGRHNILNLMAALLAAHAAGTDFDKLTSRIASFTPLPHRLQYVGCIDERHYFNDSISTIPQATVEAIRSVEELPFVKGVDCLIVGGLDRGIDYRPLADFFLRHPMESIAFVGEAGKRIHELLRQKNLVPAHSLQSGNYPQIVEWARRHTRPGHACLLSPAAASYDQFKDFAQRGDIFMRLVKAASHPA